MEKEKVEEIESKVFAERFATLDGGEIATIAEATPAHELRPNQIALTKSEYQLLYILANRFTWYQVEELIADIKSKIKANGS